MIFMKRDYGIFQVGLKILLRKGDSVLFLRMDDNHYWDLPGGRIDNVEAETSLEKVIAREVREELGSAVKYSLGKPLFQYWRATKRQGKRMPILLTIYDAVWRSGEIKISHEHSAYQWIQPRRDRLKRKDFGRKEEYEIFKKYFAENYHA